MAKNPTSLITEKELLRWVGEFIEAHELAGPHKRVVCALSGGPDSMLLSHVCEGLYKEGKLKSVRHIHIDHGLRPESGEQAFKLKGLAQKWGWDFTLQKVTSTPPKSNIEAWARRVRRHLLLSHLKEGEHEGEVLFLAHHIDDSFEWFLRQTLGSSQGTFNHGIPLINGKVRRPFHCLSRKQIERFVEQFKIPTIKDKSNLDRRFQRNQMRQDIKKPLLSMFPKGLAHYVERSNQWALKEGVDRPKANLKPLKVKEHRLSKNVVCLSLKEEGRWEEAKDSVLKTLKKLSSKERGSLRQNLSKLFETLKDGRQRGPLSFSGGVHVYIYPGTLLFTNEVGLKELIQFQEHLKKNISGSQIPETAIKKHHKRLKSAKGLPFVLFRGKTFGLKGLKNDPLFQDLIDWAHDQNLYLRPLRHLELAAIKQGRLEQKFPSIVLV